MGAPGVQDPDNMNVLTVTDLGITMGKDFVELKWQSRQCKEETGASLLSTGLAESGFP